MSALESLDAATEHLARVYQTRLEKAARNTLPASVRGPVGLFLMRADGGAGFKLAEGVVGSYGYWDARTADMFDGVFLAWGYDGGPVYIGNEAFLRCINDLETRLELKYLGRAQLLLVDFVYEQEARKGDFDFSAAINVDISLLLEERKLARATSTPSSSPSTRCRAASPLD